MIYSVYWDRGTAFAGRGKGGGRCVAGPWELELSAGQLVNTELNIYLP